MKLFFWSSKRLLPLYGWLAVGFVILMAVLSLLWHFHAPQWLTSGVILLAFVGWAIALLRAAFAQTRENARSQLGTSRRPRPIRRPTYDGS